MRWLDGVTEAVDVSLSGLQGMFFCTAVPGPCDPEDLIDGIIFAANYLGSTQLLSDKTPSKNVRMMQAQEAVSRIKARKNRENRLHKLLWDQALLQSDRLVAKLSTVVAPPKGRPTSADLPQRPSSSSIAPPSRPSEEGTHTMADQSVSLPRKQKEKKHSDSDKYPVHKKAKKDKTGKPVKKPKNPEQAKHHHSGSASSSIPIPASELTLSVPTIQVSMRVTPPGSPHRPTAKPILDSRRGSISDGEIMRFST
ncbi:Amyloid-beta A4 precursor protein-binding family A member 1 [Varanus komodoensis]|nr:Amyloid-beta A4 precursor protein-binding family A member 1 [Varanus komodoensis]